MKKNILFLVAVGFMLFTVPAQYIYKSGTKLENTSIKATNKSQIPMHIIWKESTREKKHKNLGKTIEPGKTVEITFGKVGGFVLSSGRVVYNPIQGNKAYTMDFPVDLPKHKTFAFTAATLAEIMQNVWVLGVFKSDRKSDSEEITSFEYPRLKDIFRDAIFEVGKAKKIK